MGQYRQKKPHKTKNITHLNKKLKTEKSIYQAGLDCTICKGYSCNDIREVTGSGYPYVTIKSID